MKKWVNIKSIHKTLATSPLGKMTHDILLSYNKNFDQT